MELLRIRKDSPVIRDVLYCAGGLSATEIRTGVTLRALAQRMSREHAGLLLNWIDRMGPFIEGDRQVVEDDLFYFDDIEVTDLGLGEAARWILTARQAAVLSMLAETTSRFAESALGVIHGFQEDPFNHISVPNYWAESDLAAALQEAAPEPRTWHEFLASARTRYDRLLIGDHCYAILKSRPYTRSLASAIERRLDVLQALMEEMNSDGSLTSHGQELQAQQFKGECAPFSDESDTRKQSNPQRFLFPNPAGAGVLQCTWHGKVRIQSYRIYFEWPVQPPHRQLRVCYVGPHL